MTMHHRLFSASLSDAQLLAVLDSTAQQPPVAALWTFVESPTQSGFEWGVRVPTAHEVARLWQVRVFGESFELAARRLDYDADRPWQVRIFAERSPAIAWDETNIVTETTRTSHSLALFGHATGNGAAFHENRFARASLSYPSATNSTWNASDEAELKTETIHLSDGALTRWIGIQPRTENKP